MAKEYFKLVDKGASFHDHSQNKKVVSDRVAHLHTTPVVLAAVKQNILTKVTDEDIKKGDSSYKTVEEFYKAQEKSLNELREKQEANKANRGKQNITIVQAAATVEATDEDKGKSKGKGKTAKLDDLDKDKE